MPAERFQNPHACDPFPVDGLSGSIVVAERGGDCWFVDKVEHATSAGAVGVVVFDNGGSGELLEMGALQDTDIPAYFVSASAGAALSLRLSGVPVGATARLTLDPTPTPRLTDSTQVAGFSSRGPTPGLNLKPDVAAPGVSVYTADTWLDSRPNGFNPSGYRQVQGTSLAAPVVAGAAALVWQRNPAWTAREVASALINTADQSVIEDGATARVGSVGAGLLDLEDALDPIATVEPPRDRFRKVHRKVTARVARDLHHQPHTPTPDLPGHSYPPETTIRGRQSTLTDSAISRCACSGRVRRGEGLARGPHAAARIL